jgi:arylsulfatase A-like enzyme
MRRFITVVAAAFLFPVTSDRAGAQARPPNIVVIVADDMGYGDVGVYGGKDIPTPNIDALASGGTRFTDAYVTGPFCSPTRAGLMTGRYPQRFGHEFNIGQGVPAHQDVGLPVEEVTIADRLKAAGYRSALIGKWHLGSAERFHPTRRGFDEFFGFLHGAHPYVAATPNSPNPIFDGTERVPRIPYLTDTLADRAAEFITRNRSRPFFLYLAFNAPHVPLQAPERYLARFPGITDRTRRTYAAMVSAMDDGVGKTMAALREAHLEENTLVFFFSDNGGPLGQASWNGSSNGALRGDKGDTWEGGIRVPFIIRWKGKLPEGKTDARPIVQLDVLPTALAAAAVDIKAEWKLDGVNLLPYLTGEASRAPHDALFWRTGAIMAVRQGDWKLVKMFDGPNKENPAALTLAGAELFNVRTDVGETKSLTSTYPDRVRELGDAWRRWSAQLAKPAWPSTQVGRGAVVACATRASTGTPLAPYIGTWRGRILAPGSDSALTTWTWVQRADSSGVFTFAADTTSTPARLIALAPDSIVIELTRAIRRPGNPDSSTMRIVSSACGNDVEGYVIARLGTGGAQRLRFVGARATSR